MRIAKGDEIYYYPLTRKAVCQECGQKGAAELAADDFDEMVYNGGR